MGYRSCRRAECWRTKCYGKQKVKSLNQCQRVSKMMGVALSGIAEMSWEPTSAVCHAWGACEMPTVSYRKSFLQQGGDLCFSGDFYMGELQRSDCQECLESPGQWLEGRRGFGTILLTPLSSPPLLCHTSPPRWPGCAHVL